MTRTTTEHTEATRAIASHQDAFFAAVRDSNPFSTTRVNEPSLYDVDVPSIHAAGFDRLIALADRAGKGRKGIGAVLLGGAGIGKSHLLSRLFRWAEEKDRACHVFLHNILADPERLPRYVLKCVVSLLSEGGRKPLHRSSLYRLVHGAVARSLAGLEASSVDWKRCEELYGKFVELSAADWRVGDPAGNRKVHAVLFRFLRDAYPRRQSDPARESRANAALRWLAGEEVDAETARSFGLAVTGDEPAMLKGDDEVEQVLLAIAQLALVGERPLVLCIDQADNLDGEKLKALSRFLQALLDHAVNLLVIVSGVKETLLGYAEEQVIPDACWDRIAEYKVELRRIGKEDARRILEARLERFHEPFVELEPVRRRLHEDTLFPIGRDWLAGQLNEGLEFRPRQVLIWARDAWEEEQAKLARLGGDQWLREWPKATEGRGGKRTGSKVTQAELEAAVDAAVDRKIEEQVAQRRLQPGSLPPDAGNLVGLVETLLGHCRGDGLPYTFRGVERMKKRYGRLPPYDLRVRESLGPDGREITTGVLFVTSDGRSATTALGRLLEDDQPPRHRILVTDQERRPLKTGPMGVEYYRDLTKLGAGRFEHIQLDFEQYAALDAMAGVVGLARVGDLEIELPKGAIRTVTEPEVIASHHRQDRYRLHPLLRPLLTEEPLPPEPEKAGAVKLNETDVRQYLMAQLAWRLGMSAHEVTNGYLKVQPALAIPFDEAMAQVKAIASRMHAEGLVYATPSDDDLFLQRRK